MTTTKSKQYSANMVSKYRNAVEELKHLTQKEEGAKLGLSKFAMARKMDPRFMKVIIEETKLLKKIGAGSQAAYIWDAGDRKITDAVIISALTYMSGLKHKKNVKAEAPKGENAEEILLNRARLKLTGKRDIVKDDGVFTMKHLKIMSEIPFSVPTDVQIDDKLTLKGIDRICFSVSDSTIILSAQMFLYLGNYPTEASKEYREVVSIEYVNKGFLLSPRYTGDKSGAYVIKTVDYR
jgi:hypothetical protein